MTDRAQTSPEETESWSSSPLIVSWNLFETLASFHFRWTIA